MDGRVFWSGIKETSNWKTDPSAINFSLLSEECLSTFFLDEFAFVPNHIADSFFASVCPIITSGKLNESNYRFYLLFMKPIECRDAERQRNDYVPTEVHWSEVPGRDEFGKNRQSRTPQNNNSKLSLRYSLDQLTHSLCQ